MSEILTLMSADDRRAYSLVMGAAAQKDLGASPALTHYLQATGALRTDAARVLACENFGLEDDGANKDLARAGGESASKLNSAYDRAAQSIEDARKDAEQFQREYDEVKRKKGGDWKSAKIAGIITAISASFGIALNRLLGKGAKALIDLSASNVAEDKAAARAKWADAIERGGDAAAADAEKAEVMAQLNKAEQTIKEARAAIARKTGLVANARQTVIFFLVTWAVVSIVRKGFAMARKALKHESGESVG